MSIKAFYFAYRLGSLDKVYPEWMCIFTNIIISLWYFACGIFHINETEINFELSYRDDLYRQHKTLAMIRKRNQAIHHF